MSTDEVPYGSGEKVGTATIDHKKVVKECAMRDWVAFLGYLSLDKDDGTAQAMREARKLPKSGIQRAQLILRGTGHASADLDADGKFGEQTIDSIVTLYRAAYLRL